MLRLVNNYFWNSTRVCARRAFISHDITDHLASLPLIYADDTSLLEIVDDPAVSAGRLNSNFSVWADKWVVTMNPVKFHNVVIFSEA